jgi:transposase
MIWKEEDFFGWDWTEKKRPSMNSFDGWENGKLEPFRPSVWICGPRVQRHAPQATEEVRRLAHQEVIDLEKTRFILLKNPWNLTPKENRRPSHLLKLNLPIVRAYYLKEEFQRFWDYLQGKRAKAHLKQWLWWATHSRLKPMIEFAHLIKDHLSGLLAWTKLRISNGALEGMNNKVKLVSHRSFGFRKPDYFITAIYHCCADLPLNMSYFP